MAPKFKQMLLNFGPQARLPDARTEGAVVVPVADLLIAAPAPPVMGPEPAPQPTPPAKVRRCLPLITKHEILKFRKSHSLAQTLVKFPEMFGPTTLCV